MTFLEGEGEAGANEADAGGEAGRVIEPDGDEAERAEDEGGKADALAGPEGDGLAVVRAGVLGERAQAAADEVEQREEDDGEEEVAAVLGVYAEELDAEELELRFGPTIWT